jgi:hypothetical protein
MNGSRSVLIALGAILTVGLVVVGLWGWHEAETIAMRVGWESRVIGAWAVRCMAVALVSVAQAVLLALVVERVYRTDAVCATARLSALWVCTVCVASAIALGLAGR